MKKILCLLTAFCLLFCLAACDSGDDETQGPLTLTAQSRGGNAAEFAMDGDLTKGWVGAHRASETDLQILNIDLGKRTTFSHITIDDTFAAGYTNKRPEYIRQRLSPRRYDATTTDGEFSAVNAVNSSVAKSWKSTAVPTDSAPQKMWFTLTTATKAKKITFDNADNASALSHFAVYYSSEAGHAGGFDETNYTLLGEVKDNTESVYELELTEEVSVTSMLIVICSQTNSNGATVASLDEITFYSSAPEDYSEPHQPVKFHLMGSNDGETYTVFAEENGNFNEVWEKTLDAPVTYRYIRYLVFEENGNNYPSIGEIKFE